MNYTNYSNAEIDRLIPEQRVAVDPVKRKEILSKILKTIYDELPMLVLYYEQQIFGVRSNVHDMVVTPNEYVTFTKTTVS